MNVYVLECSLDKSKKTWKQVDIFPTAQGTQTNTETPLNTSLLPAPHTLHSRIQRHMHIQLWLFYFSVREEIWKCF